MRSPIVAWLALLLAASAYAFNGHVATEGPLTVAIAPIDDASHYDTPQRVSVNVENKGDASLTVTLRMGGLVDEWRAVDEAQKQFTVGAKSQAQAVFEIACGKGAPSALWPVHIWADFAYNGQPRTLHCVQIFKSEFPPEKSQAPAEFTTAVVPPRGALPLLSVDNNRVVWNFFGEDPVAMPIGWRGSEERSRTSVGVGDTFRGARRRALQIHPPWYGKAGTVFVEYQVALPDTKPLALNFANAIRDNGPTEPPSDGVTFRVWAGDERLFERHTDAKTWLDASVDLSKFAGQTVLLRLESHPGPRNNTTCDSCFWAEPTIVAGEPPKHLTAEQRDLLGRQARLYLGSKAIVSDSRRSDVGGKVFVFDKLPDDCKAAIVPGPNGIFDAAIAFGNGDRCVVFDGIGATVLDSRIGAASQVMVESVDYTRPSAITHHLSMNGRGFDLVAMMQSDRGALRVRFECPERITDLAIGRADQKAPRVYYGHGYCVENPRAFRATHGGHDLSTSHVGFDFEKGVSLLMATDNPPDALEVSPDQNLYALHTHMNATLTFLPGLTGAFDCAIRYQRLYDKKPSPGLANKAGRFVFDIWGGRYAEIADTMQTMIDYGLTDSLLTLHVWQRWGYDYRLPDIYPPDPRYGTIEDMQKIARICNAHNIPWGLHDNYIDFYPDAEDYSYDHICYTADGRPVRAWFNEGRDAQSYRWRPDRFMPFLKRNLELIKRDLAPTHYFIDVFSSINMFDYYDKQGNFHSFLETRRCWGESFRWIQDYLGNAVTTSEAGDDALVGYLDGADCQHLTLAPEPREFCLHVPCEDWQRVPWFDAVLHDRFSLHGVGYSPRYHLTEPDDAGNPLQSDDYITAEILTGHALMIDRGGFGPAAIRKYWLAQDFIRSIATDTIARVEFADNNIHRQIVTWRSGAKVYVNRGKDDWTVAGRMLPQYGCFAKNGPIECSIERIGGLIVEQSRGPSGDFYNARGHQPDSRLGLRPHIAGLEYLGGRRFRLAVDWDVNRTPSRSLSIFLHFTSDQASRRDRIAFQGDQNPPVPMNQWSGRLTTGADRTITIPNDCRPGRYTIGIGVWDPATGRRYPLIGNDDGSTRYTLGTLIVEGDENGITNIKVEKHPLTPIPPSRRNLNNTPVDFGPITTAGALRCQSKHNALILTPLPCQEPFEITLQERSVNNITAIDAADKPTRVVPFEVQNNTITFRTDRQDFAYRLTLSD
jgi:hypothetical protein